MATATEPRPSDPSERPARSREGRVRPSAGFELGWWLFMRVSGILLLFLAVGHVLIMHVTGNGIDRVNFAFVQVRWQNPFWRTWDWLLLSLALIHGVNGLRTISQDYIRKPQIRFIVNWFFYIVTVILFALGTIIVFTFNPAAWPMP